MKLVALDEAQIIKGLKSTNIMSLNDFSIKIFDMVQECGNSGVGWDYQKNMVTIEELICESYLIVSILYELL